MNRRGAVNIEALKFLFDIGSGGIGSLGGLYGLSINSTGWVLGFLLICLLSRLFIPKASFSSAAGFGLGALIFGLMAEAIPGYGYGDMAWSIIFFVIIIGVIAVRNYLTSGDEYLKKRKSNMMSNNSASS